MLYCSGINGHPYLNPNFRYPAAFLYHSLMGIIHLFSHGRLMMKLVSDGCDMSTAVEGFVLYGMALQTAV